MRNMNVVIKAYIGMETLSTVKCLLQHIGFRPHIFMMVNYIKYNRKPFKLRIPLTVHIHYIFIMYISLPTAMYFVSYTIILCNNNYIQT